MSHDRHDQILHACLQEIPVGYLPLHTAERLPVMIRELVERDVRRSDILDLWTHMEEVAKKALETWGPDAQEQVAIGELGELLTLFGRRAQGRDTPAMWHDEIADVIMMATSLSMVHGRQGVLAALRRKLEKLEKRIDNGQVRHPSAIPVSDGPS